ncbi:MAG: RNA polymerase sigma factor [Phycisphaerales bacterium]
MSDPRYSTEPLLPRVAEGDDAAVKDVIREYGGLVWSLARRLCGNQSEAEEAVQEIFIDLWKSAARFDPSIAAERTFVAMIARRRLIDRRRKAGRRPTMTSQVEVAADAPAAGSDMEISEEARQAAEAFEQLRPEQRDVLHMAIWRNMTHEQIASATGMPLGTVKTHARRGMIRVREILAKANEAEAGSPSKGVTR